MSSVRSNSAVRFAVAAVLGSTLIAGFAAPARAQEQDLEEVQVTGSRIKRTTDFDTANPTTVVDQSYFQNLGIVNVGDAIRSLPSNVSNNSPTTTGNANFFAGSTIANLRGLNPFFGSRTLNLVNGRRHVPTNQGDGVDLNFIPSILIQRMDVVTGGASAAYGSGAISGVNNIFLDRTLDGVKVEADYGQSMHQDAQDRHYALAAGSGFADERGHFTFAVEHQNSEALGCFDVRDWCARGVGTIQNGRPGAFVGGVFTGAPTEIDAADIRSPITSGGLFYNWLGSPTGPRLAVNGSGDQLVPFTAGTGNQGFSNNVAGGSGRPVNEYTNIRAPVKRTVLTGTTTFELTDSINLTADASWGTVNTVNRTGGLDWTFGTIAPDNAYLAQRPALAAGYASSALPFPGAGFVKDWTSQIDSYSEFDTEVRRFSVGLDGRFGDSSWTWDAYWQNGKTDRTQLVNDNRHLNAYNFAVDAVASNVNPAAIECRVTQQIRTPGQQFGEPLPGTNLYNIAQGCVPLNPFGTGTIDPAAKAYAFGFLQEDLGIRQNVIAFNTTGDLWEGFGAGTVKGAAGVEYRRESGTNIGSQGGAPDYVRTDYLIQYGESFAGKVDVYEAYVEGNVPVLRDVTFAKRLEFDVAARWSRYENEGTLGPGVGVNRNHDMITWKASGFWDPVDQVRLRFSQSRDSRAANFRELYYGQIIQAGGVFGFCGPTGTQQTDPCTWSLEGNVDLKPEKADTTTVGVVLSPTWGFLDGFQFAADYFRIKITDAIQQANVTRVIDGCRVSNLPEYCSLITFDGSTYPALGGTYRGIDRVRALAFNGSAYEYRGIDFTGSYKVDMADAGSLMFRLIATRMLEQSFQPTPGQPFVDVVGQTGTANSFLSDNQPSAKWQANLSTTYANGPFSTTLQTRYIGKGTRNYLGVTPEDANYGSAATNFVRMQDNHVGSYAVFGLNANYRFENVAGAKTFDVWANIANLFDRDPPLMGGGTGGTNPVFFDTIGRYYKVGVRAAF